MRVLMLSWEYPPVVVGGLGRHVHALAGRLASAGHEVVVLCRQPFGTDAVSHPDTDTVIDGVRVVRVAEDPTQVTFEQDLVAWTLAMGHAMVRAGLRLMARWRPEVVHAHDWLVAHPAIALAEFADVGLVATVHATEAGRHGGWLSRPLNHQVHSIEWWLTNRADAVITCSAAMAHEVTHLFDIPTERVSVIHNGVDPRGWTATPEEIASVRADFAAPHRRIVLYFGRLEWEKGVLDLVNAFPAVLRAHPDCRLVIAGQGSQRQALIELAHQLSIRESVGFIGYLPDRTLAALVSAADVITLPSRYEPFGLVALEAAAAGTPLVTSTAGGLGEIVQDGRTGRSVPPGDVEALARATVEVLDDPTRAALRARRARKRLAVDFDWDRIAERTAAHYRDTRRRAPEVLGKPKISTGNVLAGPPKQP
jgi:glycogen(starch) synthase